MNFRMTDEGISAGSAEASGDQIRSGVGCLLEAIALAIVVWALSGFPGLPR